MNRLENLSNILQVLSFLMLFEDANNNDLINYLKHQDKDLLETIITQNKELLEQNNKIIHLLTEKGKEM